MELEYTVSRDQLNKAVRSISKAVWERGENKKKKYILQIAGILFWVPAGIFAGYIFSKFGNQFGVCSLYCILIGALTISGYNAFERKIINGLYDEQGSLLGKIKLSADSNGITVESKDTASSTKWSGVRNICQSGDYVLIFIDNNMGHYIPTQTFSTQFEIDSFIAELELLRLDKADASL